MNWVPESIKALTELIREIGILESSFVLAMIFTGIMAWRHSSAILHAIRLSLEVRREETKSRAVMNSELIRQTTEIQGLRTDLKTMCKATCVNYAERGNGDMPHQGN